MTITVDNLDIDNMHCGPIGETYLYANSDLSGLSGDLEVPVTNSFRYISADFWLVPAVVTTSVDIQIGQDTALAGTNYKYSRIYQLMNATATQGTVGAVSTASINIQADVSNNAGAGYGGTLEIWPGYWDTTFFSFRGILRNNTVNWYTWETSGTCASRYFNKLYFKTTAASGYNAGWMIVKGHIREAYVERGRGGKAIP